VTQESLIQEGLPTRLDYKKTLVLGASPNPSRYSNIAVGRLLTYHHPVVPLGIRKGEIDGVEINIEPSFYSDIDTVTMYLGAPRQVPYYQYIIALKPKRIIFNPGAENEELARLARKHDIEVVNACTLVMLSMGNY
jgi:predicted CoA-binding protein